MPEYTNLNDVIVDGRVESSAQGRIMGSFAVMPAASILNENCIILYSGTTGTYVSGQFYMCVESGGSYSWQPVTISGTEDDTYTANRALATNAQGKVVASGVTDTELGYLSGLGGSVASLLNGKVDKVSGMGLSQNSYTTADKDKLAGIANGAQVNVIEAIQNNGVAVPVSGKTVNITHPTKLSEFANDTQFITSTVSNLQNYYDKTNVDALISAIPKFSIQVSQSGLPASGNSTTIYLVPKTAGSQDAYDEYLYVNGQWEKIGSTQVNFSFDQSGTDILINGTAIRSATTSQSGVMTATQVGSLNAATSGVSSLQSQYGSLNSTVSDINGRLGTVESTLSTTVSQISTIGITSSGNIASVNGKSAPIVNSISGAVTDGNLKITVNGVESGDIPLPEIGGTLVTFPVHNISSVTIVESYSRVYTGDEDTILDSNYIFCNEITTTPIRNGGSSSLKEIRLSAAQVDAVADYFNEDVKVLTPRVQTYPRTVYTAYFKVVLQEGTPNTFYSQWTSYIEVNNGVLTIEFAKAGVSSYVRYSALTSLEEGATTPATFQLVGFTEI